MAITRLMVVNACLKTMGETPLNALEPDHPYVKAALATLDEVCTLEQQVGWWFNTDYVNLVPDPETGVVTVPPDALNVEPANTALVQRGRRLFDTSTSTFTIGTAVPAKIVREIKFDDLPMNVQQMVSMRAQLDFQASYDADEAKYQKIYQAYSQAYSRVRRMHIRNQHLNMLNSPQAQRVLSGIRPMTRSSLYPNRVW